MHCFAIRGVFIVVPPALAVGRGTGEREPQPAASEVDRSGRDERTGSAQDALAPACERTVP